MRKYEIVRAYAHNTKQQGSESVVDVVVGSKEDAIECMKRTWEEFYTENYFEYNDDVIKDGSGYVLWEKGDSRIGDNDVCIYVREVKSDKISMAKRWVSTGGYRGRFEPVYYVAGANDTGGYSDSPCPTEVCNRELQMVKDYLRKNGIKYREMMCATSNLFCAGRYVVVSAMDLDRAVGLIDEKYQAEWKEATRLLWVREVSNG